MRRVLVAGLLVALGACTVGGNVHTYAVTTTGSGAAVRVEAQRVPTFGEPRPSPAEIRGELLLVSTDGVLVMRNAYPRRVIHIPWEAIQLIYLEDRRFGDRQGLQSERRQAQLALWSRYPQGLSPEQLTTVLTTLGQDQPDRVP